MLRLDPPETRRRLRNILRYKLCTTLVFPTRLFQKQHSPVILLTTHTDRNAVSDINCTPEGTKVDIEIDT
jgi:hypothetical protein